MNDVVGVSRSDCPRDLLDQANRLVIGQSLLDDDRVERLTVDEFHDHVTPAIDLTGFMNSADVGMIQIRHRLGLAVEPLQHFRASPPIKVRHLQGDSAIQLSVFRQIDVPHPAVSQFPHDAKSAKRFRNFFVCRLHSASIWCVRKISSSTVLVSRRICFRASISCCRLILGVRIPAHDFRCVSLLRCDGRRWLNVERFFKPFARIGNPGYAQRDRVVRIGQHDELP